MCGIAGRFQPDGIIETGEWATKASALLAHRGPDGEGYFSDPSCELVHRRLAIVDLTPTGQQPMTNEDRSIWIVFNGEIYGYESLRKQLIQKGHIFHSTSDTEVLLHLYEECGTAMLSELRGIFAFAIYDQKRRSLLLARDRFGTKPLYYTVQNGQWIFASELKAILAWKGISPEIDRQAVYDFLSWGYIPEPATGFLGIHALPKGSFALVQPKGPSFHKYYEIQPVPAFRGSAAEAAQAVSEKLQDAIRVQKVADVPVGSLLSGGIDSGLVTAAYAKVSTQDFFTFTVGFPDAAYDESELAAEAAAAFHTNHTVISSADWQISEDQAVQLLTHFDQPFADTSLFGVNMVSQGIHAHGLRCAFSGDGGDEAFGGYGFFRHLSRLLALRRFPEPSRALALSGSHFLLAGSRPGAARQIRRAIHITNSACPSEFLSQMVSYLTETQKQALIAPEARQDLLPANRFYQRFERGWDLQEMTNQLTSGMFDMLLPGDMLKKVDMMSMKNSVEIRVPMLDEALVDFAAALPLSLKASQKQNKIVLRALAEQWLPARITRAKKRGFGVPMDILTGHRFKESMRDFLLAPGARTTAFIQPAQVRHWMDLFTQQAPASYALEISREGLYQRLFFLFSLELWMRNYQLQW